MNTIRNEIKALNRSILKGKITPEQYVVKARKILDGLSVARFPIYHNLLFYSTVQKG